MNPLAKVKKLSRVRLTPGAMHNMSNLGVSCKHSCMFCVAGIQHAAELAVEPDPASGPITVEPCEPNLNNYHISRMYIKGQHVGDDISTQWCCYASYSLDKEISSKAISRKVLYLSTSPRDTEIVACGPNGNKSLKFSGKRLAENVSRAWSTSLKRVGLALTSDSIQFKERSYPNGLGLDKTNKIIFSIKEPGLRNESIRDTPVRPNIRLSNMSMVDQEIKGMCAGILNFSGMRIQNICISGCVIDEKLVLSQCDIQRITLIDCIINNLDISFSTGTIVNIINSKIASMYINRSSLVGIQISGRALLGDLRITNSIITEIDMFDRPSKNEPQIINTSKNSIKRLQEGSPVIMHTTIRSSFVHVPSKTMRSLEACGIIQGDIVDYTDFTDTVSMRSHTLPDIDEALTGINTTLTSTITNIGSVQKVVLETIVRANGKTKIRIFIPSSKTYITYEHICRRNVNLRASSMQNLFVANVEEHDRCVGYFTQAIREEGRISPHTKPDLIWYVSTLLLKAYQSMPTTSY